SKNGVVSALAGAGAESSQASRPSEPQDFHQGFQMEDIVTLPRRQFLHLAVGAAALPALSSLATAQAYPSRPITMTVPFAPGGSTDVVARVLAERMKDVLGQPVIIENVAGANGSIGIGRAARARPDGYTIDLGS